MLSELQPLPHITCPSKGLGGEQFFVQCCLVCVLLGSGALMSGQIP